MVVRDFYVVCIPINDSEAYAPLFIHRDSVLSLAIPTQPVQTVAGRHLQIAQACCEIDIFQPASSASSDIRRIEATSLAQDGHPSPTLPRGIFTSLQVGLWNNTISLPIALQALLFGFE